MAAQAPEASPPPTTPMDPISAIQVQLQAMVKAAGDCLEASTQHNAAASDVIDMKVQLACGDELWVCWVGDPPPCCGTGGGTGRFSRWNAPAH